MKKRIILVAFLVLLVGVGIFVYVGQQKMKSEEHYYPGTIESVRSELAFQVGGKIEAVHVDEGGKVSKGQLLAELDDDEYRAHYEEAEAAVRVSERNIITLESQLDMYRSTISAEIARAEAAVESATAVLREAESDKARYDDLLAQKAVSKKEWDTINLRRQTADAQLREAAAQLRQAKSNLKKVKTTAREIETAKANLEAVKAALDLARIRLDHTRLKAPFQGIITSRNLEPGEVVTTGQEVLTLADLSSVDLKIFVEEEEIGKVKPGQAVEVKTDTFPDKTYHGTVSFVSPEGEFTPKIIQTHKERVKLVYLVKITIANPDLELKPGMPADAWLK